MNNLERITAAFAQATHNHTKRLEDLINGHDLSAEEKELCLHMMVMVEGRREQEEKIAGLNKELGRLDSTIHSLKG